MEKGLKSNTVKGGRREGEEENAKTEIRKQTIINGRYRSPRNEKKGNIRKAIKWRKVKTRKRKRKWKK